jgi:hypothetical protein
MNAILKSFLLVSAAYLLGVTDSALADTSARERTAQGLGDRVVEEGQPATGLSQPLLPNLLPPTGGQDGKT